MKKMTKRGKIRQLTTVLRSKKCVICGKKLPQPHKDKTIKGRPRTYCSPVCRQTAYAKRKFGQPGHLRALMQDISTYELRIIVRQVVKAEFEKLGVIVDPPQPKKKPVQRLVKPDSDDDAGGSPAD